MKIWWLLGRIIVLSLVSVLLVGCGLTKGNAASDIEQAVKTVEDRYGITLTVRKKALLPRGVACDVTTRCKEFPNLKVRVFRFDKSTRVQSDFIYQKYGDESYDRICTTVHTIYPDALVVVEDSKYNHFTDDWYDGNTTIEDYVLDNPLSVNIVLLKIYDDEEIREAYHRMAVSLLEAGINSHGLGMYCMREQADIDAIKTYDHIPDPQAFKGIPDKGLRICANNNYGTLKEYLEDPENAGVVIRHGASKS